MQLTYKNIIFWYMTRKENIQKTEVCICTDTLRHLIHTSILEAQLLWPPTVGSG